MSIDKQFLPYELALELKGLGFDEKCISFYDKYENLYESEGYYSYKKNVCSDEVIAPIFAQAFRWFREKHGYNCFITITLKDNKWYYFRENLNDRSDNSEPELTPKFDAYEEAELCCLKKLIEIVKTK